MTIHIESLDFPIKDSSLREAYQKLLPEEFHICLEGTNPFHLSAQLVGFGLFSNHIPVGIALASLYSGMQIYADIHALTISPEVAKTEFYTLLLKKLSEVFLKHQIPLTTFKYLREDPLKTPLEQAFFDQLWQGPEPFILECYFKPEDFTPPWFYKQIPLPSDIEEIPFKNLTPEEKRDLHYRSEQMSIPDYVFPFGKEDPLIDHKNSLALRHQNRIIGWIVVHRLKPHLIRYSALYIERDFSSTLYWLKLIADSVFIHTSQEKTTVGCIEINVKQIPKKWHHFIKNKLMPYAFLIQHKDLFWKSFQYIE